MPYFFSDIRTHGRRPVEQEKKMATSRTGDLVEADDDAFYVDDTWTLYFHDPSNNDWQHSSYVRLGDVSSLEDVSAARAAMRDKVSGGMFFLMREHVFPCWDDPNNIEGGCLTVRIPKVHAESAWNGTIIDAVCENLATAEEEHGGPEVNGVSISPKAVYSVLKFWVASEVDPKELRLPPEVGRHTCGQVLFKANRDYIRSNNEALTLASLRASSSSSLRSAS